MSVADSARAAAAEGWFGYGRWSAPFWFVGMEQGGDAEEQRSYLAWHNLGAPELLDCREHHLAVDDPAFWRWHSGDRPPTQPTWRRLIQLLLGFKGLPSTLDHVRAYQRDCWGSAHGETAVLELTALRARNLSVDIKRSDHRDSRVATLRERLRQNRPTFIVCYGTGYRADYERVLGSKFDAEGLAWTGGTVAALTRHPVARGSDGVGWEDLGRILRAKVAMRGQG